MLVVVCYDVSTQDAAGEARLRRVAKLCEDVGQRVQNSVFECLTDPAQWIHFKDKLLREFDPTTDSLRFYFLGANWQRRVEHHGAKKSWDPQGLMLV